MPILIVIICLILMFCYPKTVFIILLSMLSLGIIFTILNSGKKVNEEEEKRKKLKQNKEKYEDALKKYNIDTNKSKVTFKNGFNIMSKVKQYVWVENNELCFFPAEITGIEGDYSIYKIKTKDIEYFSTRGEVYRENKITGGGGQVGGSSVTGAIVGGVIAGGAGAIIGSRKKGKIEPIKSEIITHDTRETFLNYFVGGKKHSLFFKFEDRNILLEVIPEKEFFKVSNQQLMKNINPNKSKGISETIKELNELMKEGLITQEEFNTKKQELLSRI